MKKWGNDKKGEKETLELALGLIIFMEHGTFCEINDGVGIKYITQDSMASTNTTHHILHPN